MQPFQMTMDKEFRNEENSNCPRINYWLYYVKQFFQQQIWLHIYKNFNFIT